MCGPQVRFCERGPWATGGPYSTEATRPAPQRPRRRRTRRWWRSRSGGVSPRPIGCGSWATENGWRARKIREEGAKLGIHLGKPTISRYLPTPAPGQDPQQRWTTFLRNHREVIAGMDFFVVPTVRFRLPYAWFATDHGVRRILHFNVTAHPTTGWVMQQPGDAFPGVPSHRHLIFDNDSVFSPELVCSV